MTIQLIAEQQNNQAPDPLKPFNIVFNHAYTIGINTTFSKSFLKNTHMQTQVMSGGKRILQKGLSLNCSAFVSDQFWETWLFQKF